MKHLERIRVSKEAFDAICDGRKRFDSTSVSLNVEDTVRFETGDTSAEKASIAVTVDWIENAGRTDHPEVIVFSFTPHNRNFLVCTPNDESECYSSLEKALEAAKDCINDCRPEYPGDSWHDETDCITIGTFYHRVIWRATAVNVEPVTDEDDDGNEVETGDFTCDYEMKEEK